MTELDKIPFYNQVMDKTSMKQLIGRLVAHLGSRHTTRVLDQLKTLGFQYATQAGISLGIDDLVTTPSKGWLIQDAEQQAHLSEKLQQHGSIHAVEKLRQLVETWYTTSEYLKREMTPNFRMTNPLNPVHLMSFSGARGSVSQVHQLVGMRGLMSDPQGQIIDLPIQSNFREGLSLTEYIISCYGARKGVVDTAVRTADAGYLTRRLVEVVQHVVVRKVDCGALEGVTLGSIQNHRGKPCVSWEQRLIGRVLAVSVFVGGQLMAPRNQEIGVALANRFANSKAMRVQIRSPMTCQGVQWVCQLCYGWSPSHGRMVAIGEAVGIIAGQSIGEPGTQLTLRTFHTGGVFTGDIAEHVRAPLNGVVSFDAALAHPTRTRHGRPAFICQSALPVIITGQERDHTLRVPSKSLLLVSNQEPVEAKQVIAEIRATTAPFKERVQKHIYSDLPGEMHWGKAVCHAPRRTRLSSLLATGHLWVLSGQLRPIIKQFFLFYEEADHIDQYQIIGDQAWIHGVRRAKCSYVRGTYHSVSRIFQRSLVCNHWSLGLEASLAKVQSVLSFPISFLLPRKDTHHHVTYHVLATCYEPQYQMESGGILKYGSVKTEPFIAIRNTALGSSQEYVQTVTTTLLREGSNSLSHIKKDIKSFLGKRNQEATLLFRVIQEGSLFWVPEETYLLAPSLFPYIQDGHFIVANSEIADGVFSKSAGLAQVNHLPHNQYEIHLLPGFLYSTDELQLDISKANTLVSPGELVIKGVPLQAWFFLELLTLPKKGKQWLLRPAMQFHVNSRPSGLRHKESQGANKEWSYCIPYADGARVNSQAGVQLLQTCLLHGPVSQQELQWKIQNEKVNQKVDPYDQSENVADMARFSLTERNSEAFVTNFSAGSLHSLIGTESFSEILILSRNDLLKTSSPTSSRKSLVANYVHVAYEHNAVGLIGHTCLPSGMAHVFRLDSYTSKCDAIRPSTRFSWRIIDEQATTHNLSALARLRFAELKRIKWSQLGQLMCEGISLEGEWSCPESGQIIAVDHQSTVLRLARPTLVTAKAAVHTRHAGLVREGDPLITLVYERLRSGDIIQGLPKVEQLLEARSIHARGFHLAHPKSEWKRQLLFALEDACMQANRTNFEIRHLQLSLIDEVQRVYQSQGVLIADKHVEIIVRQMTSKVLVEDVSTNQLQPFEPRVIKAHFNWLSVIPSYDGCLPGQFIELNRAHNMAYLPGQSMPYRPLLLGITKASFHTDSVLSEASFQQTIRALSLGALQGRIDWLKGLKEKVMIGDLIPAGTGCEEVVWQHEVVDNMSHLDVFSPGKTSLFYKRNQTLRHCASVLAKPHIV